VPVLQFLDIQCRVLHSASNFLAAPERMLPVGRGRTKSAVADEMLICNNNRFSSLSSSTCSTPLRSGQTIRRETECGWLL